MSLKRVFKKEIPRNLTTIIDLETWKLRLYICKKMTTTKKNSIVLPHRRSTKRKVHLTDSRSIRHLPEKWKAAWTPYHFCKRKLDELHYYFSEYLHISCYRKDTKERLSEARKMRSISTTVDNRSPVSNNKQKTKLNKPNQEKVASDKLRHEQTSR